MLPLVIASQNRCELLRQTIESALKNADNKLEIIVVNDNSTDETGEYLDTLKDIKHYDSEEPMYIAKAKNKGIEMASKSKYIYISDNDVYFLPHWDSILIKVLETFPDIGVVGGMKHPHHRVIIEPPEYMKKFFDEKYILQNSRMMGDVCVNIVEQQAGYSFMLRRKELNKLNGFRCVVQDNRPAGEDCDFNDRMMAMGKFIASVEPPVLFHCGMRNFSGFQSADYPEMLKLQKLYPYIKFL